jgi:hypothetical protein
MYQKISTQPLRHHRSQLNFKLMGPKAQWHDRFQHAPKHHFSVAWNQHAYTKSCRNFGGVANISDADFTHRVDDSGNDPSGLGNGLGRHSVEKNKSSFVSLRVIAHVLTTLTSLTMSSRNMEDTLQQKRMNVTRVVHSMKTWTMICMFGLLLATSSFWDWMPTNTFGRELL